MLTKTRQVVAVDWFDAAGDTAWTDENDAKDSEPPLCTTVGIVISRTKRKLVIAGTVGHGDDDQVGDVNVIPAGMVSAIRPLGEITIETEKRKVAKTRTRSNN